MLMADGRLNGGVINQRGGREGVEGLRHRFAAAWVRVRAAFGDG